MIQKQHKKYQFENAHLLLNLFSANDVDWCIQDIPRSAAKRTREQKPPSIKIHSARELPRESSFWSLSLKHTKRAFWILLAYMSLALSNQSCPWKCWSIRKQHSNAKIYDAIDESDQEMTRQRDIWGCFQVLVGASKQQHMCTLHITSRVSWRSSLHFPRHRFHRKCKCWPTIRQFPSPTYSIIWQFISFVYHKLTSVLIRLGGAGILDSVEDSLSLGLIDHKLSVAFITWCEILPRFWSPRQ